MTVKITTKSTLEQINKSLISSPIFFSKKGKLYIMEEICNHNNYFCNAIETQTQNYCENWITCGIFYNKSEVVKFVNQFNEKRKKVKS